MDTALVIYIAAHGVVDTALVIYIAAQGSIPLRSKYFFFGYKYFISSWNYL